MWLTKTSIAVGVVLVMALPLAMGAWRDHRLANAYSRVQPGMSESHARGILGWPAWRGQCGDQLTQGYSDDCMVELVYGSSFAPLIPEYFVVELDRRGRVISVTRIVSP